MDGWTLDKALRESINEDSDSGYLNKRMSYEWLWEAAIQLNSRLAAITGTQTITTVAEQSEYTLNPDFMGLYLRDINNDLYVKHTDSSSNVTFILFQEYDALYYQNNTTSADLPYRFSLKDATTQVSNITGTASAIGAVANGEATLTDTSSTTQFANVSVGDLVHDTTHDYHGIVISKTSNTALVTAIFDEAGTAYGWAASDAYIIVPQGRFSIVVDPPSKTAGYSITVPYIKKPTPVFSPYRTYPFPATCMPDLVQYAAFKYKYRDREPGFGDKFAAWFDRAARTTNGVVRKGLNRGGFSINMKGNKRGR